VSYTNTNRSTLAFIAANTVIIIIIIYPRYQGSREIWEKINVSNCRSDHYSGQSSRTNESWSRTLSYRCNKTETRWNKKAVSRSSAERWL